MRVTMLGISGSGKTSYMAGLAQRMCNIGVGGFTISPTGHDAATAAIERSKFTRLMFSSNDYDFPPGTTNTTDWIFALSKDGGSGVHFEWIDFRGGFLDQLQTGIDPSSHSDVQTLLQYAQASDAILVFVDSIRLFKYQGNQAALEQNTRLPALFQYLIDSSISQGDNVKRTLVVVNTKADSDLLPQSLQANHFSQLNDLARRELEKYLQPLYKFGWNVAICSAGAVGIGCVTSIETPAKSFKQIATIAATITDHPNPVNVETPLLYCLLQEIRRISSLVSNSVAHKEYAKRKMERENVYLDYIKSALQKTETVGQRLSSIDKKLLEEKTLLKSFQSLIPELENLIRGKIQALTI
jgi:hypothetical protein